MTEWTPTLKQLEILLLVAQTGSLTRVAEMLGITQPAVSHNLRSMEDGLGYRLFARTNGGLQPTEQVAEILPQLVALHEQFERLIARMRRLREAETDVLRVASLTALSATLVPGAILDFSKQFPAVRVQALAGTGREVTELVQVGSVDFGLVYTAPDEAPPGAEALLDTEIVCFGSRSRHPKRRRPCTAGALAGHTVIVAGSDTATGLMVRRGLGDFASNRIAVIEANTALNALSLAREGLGIALVDPMLATGQHAAGLAVWPFAPSIPIRLVALLSQPRDRLRTTDRFVEHLKQAATVAVGKLDAASITARLCAPAMSRADGG